MFKKIFSSNAEKIPAFIYDVTRFGTRPSTCQRDELAGSMWWHHYDAKCVCIPFVGKNRGIYIDSKGMSRGYERLVRTEFSSPAAWKKHLQKYTALIKRLENLRLRALACGNKSIKEVSQVYREWLEAALNLGVYLMAPYSVENLLDPECRRLLHKEFADKADDCFVTISSSSKINEFQNMRLAIISSRLTGQPTPRNIADRYYWYSEYAFIEPFLNVNHFKKEITALNKGRAEAERNKILEDIKKNKQNYVALQRKIKNPRLKLLTEIVHTYSFLRNDRIDWLKKCQAGMRNIYKMIASSLASRTGKPWTRDYVVACTNNELLAFLEKGEPPSWEEICRRRRGNYVYYKDANIANTIEDPALVAKIRRIVEESEHKGEEIKGTVAFKGKVRGHVAMVLDKADLKNVKSGDILVAKVTMPDYTAAMRLASAFVTEEGGITSHAAIIAREMKKPCIVGTGNCTRILKDGDLVEVDANQEVVRKI